MGKKFVLGQAFSYVTSPAKIRNSVRRWYRAKLASFHSASTVAKFPAKAQAEKDRRVDDPVKARRVFDDLFQVA